MHIMGSNTMTFAVLKLLLIYVAFTLCYTLRSFYSDFCRFLIISFNCNESKMLSVAVIEKVQ